MTRAYREGMQAKMDGLELWENPYASPKDNRSLFHEWMAGWMYAAQGGEA